MKRVFKNHKGFTLVELIVSVAVLSIIMLGACAFMMAGTRSYANLNETVKLQYEAQLIMAQLQEYTVDCTDGIVWDASDCTLYIDNGTTVHAFHYVSTDSSIYYGSGTAAATLSITPSDLMAEHVSGLSASFGTDEVSITLRMERGSKSYTATQVIALRNKPETADSWADLWSALHP